MRHEHGIKIGVNGFHITFANGNTVSVQQSSRHYSDERTAEVATWDVQGRWPNAYTGAILTDGAGNWNAVQADVDAAQLMNILKRSEGDKHAT